MNFEKFVQVATGGQSPYPYQERLAEQGLPDVLRVPTGAGKTLAAVLPWLYRRQISRKDTPHWLVVVLPQRTLVEQTVREVGRWVHNLGLPVPVHVLMGGEDPEEQDWKIESAADRIFIGTQDMVLSRLLMRGFAENRNAWPMSFGLLHAGVQFVFDEVQLMGPGLPTSVQLAALRERLGTAVPCRSMWMSATVDREQLCTVDSPRKPTPVELTDADLTGELGRRIRAARTVRRLELPSDNQRYVPVLAERIVTGHRLATRTLVIVNTVDRAVRLTHELNKRTEVPVVLLHSRFRPGDRKEHLERALAAPAEPGLIVVSTQVTEAGVDITSTTLITETAPWSSIVQRAGRCNRDGRATDARLLWTSPPDAAPYDQAELDTTAQTLAELEGQSVTGMELAEAGPPQKPPDHPVLRMRDLMDLFDTSPDLDGNDIDVSQYIRDADNRVVWVAWRSREQMDDPKAQPPAVNRTELCPAPIEQVRKLVFDPNRPSWMVDQGTGRWRRATREDVRPTAVVAFDAAHGGYLAEHGFAPDSRSPVEPLPQPDEPIDGVDTDPSATGCSRWVPLAEHLADVEREAYALLRDFGDVLGLTDSQMTAIALAGRYHDLGKAHPVFRDALHKANLDNLPPDLERPWAKSPGGGRLQFTPPHFRHELVSALLLADSGLLDEVAERDLVTYLVLAHHGKVRLAPRGKPDEPEDRVLGVTKGDWTLDADLPDGSVLPGRELSLDLTRFGNGSLPSRALALRDRADLGPFRLAFCEAVLRAADWKASASYGGRGA